MPGFDNLRKKLLRPELLAPAATANFVCNRSSVGAVKCVRWPWELIYQGLLTKVMISVVSIAARAATVESYTLTYSSVDEGVQTLRVLVPTSGGVSTWWTCASGITRLRFNSPRRTRLHLKLFATAATTNWVSNSDAAATAMCLQWPCDLIGPGLPPKPMISVFRIATQTATKEFRTYYYFVHEQFRPRASWPPPLIAPAYDGLVLAASLRLGSSISPACSACNCGYCPQHLQPNRRRL